LTGFCGEIKHVAHAPAARMVWETAEKNMAEKLCTGPRSKQIAKSEVK